VRSADRLVGGLKISGLGEPRARRCALGFPRQKNADYARRCVHIKGLGRGVRPSPISTGAAAQIVAPCSRTDSSARFHKTERALGRRLRHRPKICHPFARFSYANAAERVRDPTGPTRTRVPATDSQKLGVRQQVRRSRIPHLSGGRWLGHDLP
jgi:hypothetical protein